ncbi:MAG: hypothetical protein A2504_06510 [Bdellovibrionales bacterium RIFOXYD12_FULL_39_22]|nr:MAG: hypothetical protein A2385_08830 [Bdellovibrionales bacterium RIFOXYB1_FULL_39_21]OFZ45196.1 MAG: hypothetical protein A2485_05705 [Bdellovibrionales bacterium RIFOXYC12_FULL_39_17]OFZ45612.1 MAG: hypothetical protein A2404_03410 [Bdellovibrionales bacterium RIFOXYC1_FULL_39_130]OFZ77474.1 MAG: hypothetical protein A2560_09000 [Bdellovibrionales bacterium RIFOXYD1_FULL_39_84]OFZ91603.1 MAG: hypothetical protein A2504_06510 [Bdellovibrionales bacterium RIFOXYD12_FULL_39_22]HLE11935.1 Pa
MAQKLALGKGIASLIQSQNNSVINEAVLRNNLIDNNSNSVISHNVLPTGNGEILVNLSEIKVNPNQPRKIFKEKDLEELSNSIRENGIIQPLIVVKKDDGYELIAGERRLRAARLAEIEQVPVVVKTVTDKDKMIMSIIENVQRADLNCVEEALAYFQLMDDFKLTQEEVAKKLGKERSSIANYLRILKLPREVIDMLQREQLSFGHAKILAAMKEIDKTVRVANICASKNLSVRELEELIKKVNRPEKLKEENRNPFLEEKADQLRQQLEKKTGFHFAVTTKKNGAGQLVIKFSNEAEFNDIYQYMMKH